MKLKNLLTIIILSLFLLPSKGLAHDASYGFSSWRINQNEIKSSISIDQKSMLELGKIDKNEDGEISEQEVKDSLSFIMPYFKSQLTVTNNDEVLPLDLKKIVVPDFTVVQFDFVLKSSQPIEKVKIDYKLFYEKSRNKHKNIATIYLPSDKTEEHIFKSDSSDWSVNVDKPTSLWKDISQFIVLGIEHILSGYDHILFLIALVVIGLSIKEVIKVITSFTIAHSITLILSALDILSLNSRFVESMIALSICYVAAENIFKKKAHYRWLITFAFGLVHGFGFASVLREIGIPKNHFIPSLLSFNVGVELGQLLLFIVILPILYFLRKMTSVKAAKIGISGIVFIFGAVWFVQRAFGV